MSHAWQWLRSLAFVLQSAPMMLVIGVLYLPWAAVSREGARAACKAYSRWCFWTLRWMVGVNCEVRGDVPRGEVLIAAKHQSFLDIMMIFTALPRAKFIMKREIYWTPVIGLYAWRLDCVAVNRGKRGQAIRKMVADVESGRVEGGQLTIYSQGTRTKPGVKVPYKIGSAVLYEELGQTCVPAATNAGVFWPRRGVMKTPGTAVVEFLDPIPPGLSKEAFLETLETRVEAASDALLEEAGFRA